MRTLLHRVLRRKTAKGKSQRIYPGQELAGPLVKCLNRKPGKDLLELLDAAERHRKALESGTPVRRPVARWMVAKVNAILTSYTYSPIVEGINHRWKVEWCAREGNTGEAWIVLFVIDLAQRGLLHKVRRCAYPNCARWFFAISDSKRFHRPACAKKNFRSKPEWKQHRAEYMRDYRQKPVVKKRKGGKRT